MTMAVPVDKKYLYDDNNNRYIQNIVSSYLSNFYTNEICIPVKYKSNVIIANLNSDTNNSDIVNYYMDISCDITMDNIEHNRLKLVYPESYEYVKLTDYVKLRSFVHLG